MALSMARKQDGGEASPGPVVVLAGFRRDVYWSLTFRRDALFELCDAVLLAPGRVTDLARLSLVPEFRRGHGGLYDGLNAGQMGFARLRRALAGLPLPEWPDGRIRLAVDVPAWLRPDESPAVAAIWEEIGVDVRLVRLLDVLGGPDYEVSYPNGDRVAYVTAVYEARVVGGSPVVSDGELSELAWFGTGDLPGLGLSRFARALLSATGRL